MCSCSPPLPNNSNFKQLHVHVEGNVKGFEEVSYLIELDSLNNKAKVIGKARKKFDHDDFRVDFDENKNPIRCVYFNSKGDTTKRISYTYNSNGECTHERETELGKNMIRERDYEILYDDSQIRVMKKLLDGSGMILSYHKYIHNAEDQVLTEFVHFGTGDLSYRKISYFDEAGNLTDVQWQNTDEFLFKRVKYIHDSKGNINEELLFLNGIDEAYTHWKYEYAFDETGNWISRVDYLGGIPRYKIIRSIHYY